MSHRIWKQARRRRRRAHQAVLMAGLEKRMAACYDAYENLRREFLDLCAIRDQSPEVIAALHNPFGDGRWVKP